MHGAMFVDGMEDSEGDWYASLRKVVGPKCLLSASYDLHGNISKRVIANLNMLSAFRTAPHIDREETMRRSCDMLHPLPRHKRAPHDDLGADSRSDARRTNQHRMGARQAPVGTIAGSQRAARRARRFSIGRLCVG